MKSILLQRWRAFSKNEKMFLSIISAIFALLFLYAFVWAPINQGRERLSIAISRQNGSLLTMKSQAAEIESRRKHYKLSAQSIANLQTFLSVSAKTHGITVESVTVGSKLGSHAVDLSIKQIDFNTWVTWLDALQSEDGIRLAACTIRPAGIPGKVMLNATLVAKQ